MMRVKITLAYEGTDYSGWQMQKNGPTVQQTVQEALARICGHEIRVHGAGRTDAGVHALGQVAHFDAPGGKSGFPWLRALNSLLPSSVRIVGCEEMPGDFHARFSARIKHYSYTLWTGQFFVYPQRRRFVWNVGKLDHELMRRTAGYLCGRHDFSSFMNKGTQIINTTRCIQSIDFKPGYFLQETVVHIRSDGFLKQMARNIIGALVQAGKEKLDPEDIKKILAQKNRILAPGTAPARGLCLERVEY